MSSSVTQLGGNPPSATVDARTALSNLFDQHYAAVFGFCLARTGNEAAADDIASETFMQAARWFADGRGQRVDRRWLFVTARSRLTDRWRRFGRERTRFQQLVSAGSHVAIDDSGGSDHDIRENVLSVLASLPERQCAALALRYLEERSVAEVAETMEVSYRTAESLLSRGRRGFLAAWEANGD
ncbi:MAG: RNA polymerase sigma factor [Acidimicrobiales bacterium]